MNLKHFFYRLIDTSEHSYKSLAEFINTHANREAKTSETILRSKFNPNSTSHYANLEDAHCLLDLAGGWPALAEYAAIRCDRVVVKLPDGGDGDMGLLDSQMKVEVARGIVSEEFMKAFADGRIDDAEWEKIKAAKYKEIASGLAWLKNVDRIRG